MTFWLFRKPRLYRILAPLEPQPRPPTTTRAPSLRRVARAVRRDGPGCGSACRSDEGREEGERWTAFDHVKVSAGGACQHQKRRHGIPNDLHSPHPAS